MKRRKVTEGADSFLEGVRKYKDVLARIGEGARLRSISYPLCAFVFALFLSMVKGPLGTYPFAFSTLMAATGGVEAISVFFGVFMGAAAERSAARMAIIASLFAIRLGICFISGQLKKRPIALRRLFCERGYVRVILAAIGAAAYGVCVIFLRDSIYYGIFSALLSMGLSAFCTAAISFFRDKGAERQKRVAGLAVLSVGVCASLELFGIPFNLGAVAAFIISIWFSYAKNAAVGSVVGLFCAFSFGGKYGAAFGSVALISALLWDYSRAAAVVASALCASVISLFCAGLDSLSDVIPELALGAAIAAPLAGSGFLPAALPRALCMDSETLVPAYREEGQLFERYDRIGGSFDELSKMLRDISGKMCVPTKSEAQRICAAARAKHCTGCVHEGECSTADDKVVTSFFNNMAYRLSVYGNVTARIVPESIAARCYNMDLILEGVNSACRRMAGLSGEAKRTENFAEDYGAVADLLREVSQDEGAERDTEAEAALKKRLAEEGFFFSSCSVYGKRSPRIYMRGIDLKGAAMGENDLRLCAEEVLGKRLSHPEFSIDSQSVGASIHAVPRIKVKSGRYSVCSQKESTSGDCACTFENPEGFYYALVSDGMGSGRDAAMTSGISASFLEKLLSAGCPIKSSLELLNCFVRGSERECFTTVDLMEADLYQGRARFIKSGAAPSFILRKGQLYRIHSKTVPVGIMRALDAESVAFDLEAGDTVIMMSDGVSGSYEESPWLYDLLSEEAADSGSPSAIARRVAVAAANNTGRIDDITVCVMKIEDAEKSAYA